MPLRVSLGAGGRQPVPIDELGLPEHAVTQLKEALGGRVTFAGLQSLTEDRVENTASPRTRALARWVQESLRGDSRSGQAVSLTGEGVYDVRDTPVLTTRKVKAVEGEPEELANLRQALANGLWGQEETLEGFMRLAKDQHSSARRTPPVLSLAGDVGHGKEQALELFCKSFLGEKATVVTVDFAGLTDRDVGAVFGDDGPLGAPQLKKLAKTGAVLHIVDPDELDTRAPKLAAELKNRLVAREGEALYFKLPWVLDFNQTEGSAREHTATALGAVGNRTLSGTAEFNQLDWKTMWRWAQTVLPEILEKEDLAGLHVEFDPSAQETLGRALATPHTPMYELEQRLHRLVVTHIDTQTSIDRDTAAIRISVNPMLPDTEVEAFLQDLHTEFPDLVAAEELFSAMAVGKRVVSLEQREQLLELLNTFAASLPSARDALFEGLVSKSPLLKRLSVEFDEGSWEFALSAVAALENAQSRASLGFYELIMPGEWEELLRMRETLKAVLDTYGGEGLEAIRGLVESGAVSQERADDLEEKFDKVAETFDSICEGFAQLADASLPEEPEPADGAEQE